MFCRNLKKWNVTPLLLGVCNLYFFTDLYCARIGINAGFALPMKEGGKERAFRPIRAHKMDSRRELKFTSSA